MGIFEHSLDVSEARRLQAVSRFERGCPDAEATCARFTRLAGTMFDVPMAVISLVGEQTVQFRSPFGFQPPPLPRGGYFCDAVIDSDTVLVVEDVACDCGMLASEPAAHLGIRFYAGAPLIDPNGHRLGAFAIADIKARHDFTPAKQAMLAELARAVVGEMELLSRLAEKRSLAEQLSFRQQLADIAAAAPTLGAALDDMLRHAGLMLGLTYLSVSEGDIAASAFRVIASYARHPEVEARLLEERRSSWRPLSELSCAEVFTSQVSVDSGPVEQVAHIETYPGFALAAARGTRRQISVPITVDARRFELSVGYPDDEISPDHAARRNDLASGLTTVLRGRLREEALARSRSLLERANRALQTLFAANESVARATDEVALSQAICQHAVEIGRYTAAWVGFAEADDAATLRPVALAGTGISRIREIFISWGDNRFGRGPSGTAVRENRPVIVNDVLNDRQTEPWSRHTEFQSYTSAIALPLCGETGQTFGCLTLLANDRADHVATNDPGFDTEEVRVLTQLARDLALGIGTLRTRIARDHAVADQRRAERRLTQLLDASPTVVYALEQSAGTLAPFGWTIVEVSPNIQRLYGHAPDDVVKPGWWLRHVHPDDCETVIAAERRLHETGRLVHHYRFANRDGIYRWMRDEQMLVRGAPGGIDRVVGAAVDVTAQYEANEEIHRLAYFDPLTGLSNRASLHQSLKAALAPLAEPPARIGALMFIDLKGFEAINDRHGHAIGDLVLGEVATRLAIGVRRKDLVARLGGDKFGILLPGLAEESPQAAAIARRIAGDLLRALTAPIHVAAHECHVTADVGITLLNPLSSTVEGLFHEADIAVHQAQLATHTAIMFFEPAMQDRVAHRHAIEIALRHAIDHDRFELWLQSQVDRDGAITGAEALIRLRQPDGTIMPPDAFIPVAEATGMIFALGRWVFAAVGRILAEQRAAGHPLRIAVNVSAAQFHDPAFTTELEDALTREGADPHDLILEITETTLIDRGETTIAKLNHLAGLGIRLSVDDFGIGYSSLGYLQSLPVSELKIDRSFVQSLPDNARDYALAEAILALASHLGLAAVAEGVETEAQATFLRDRHCQTMQGYLFGRPEAAASWLKTSWNRQTRPATALVP